MFDADQQANKLTSEKLKSLVSQVAGTDDDMTARISSTFNALSKIGNFDAPVLAKNDDTSKEDEDEESDSQGEDLKGKSDSKSKTLKTEFHYNIQIHLPSNGTEDVYLNIFNALRKTFQ